MKTSFKRRLGAVIAAAAAITLLSTGCSPAESDNAKGGAGSGGSLTFGVSRSPNSLDPLLSYLGGQYLAFLDPAYDTLIRMAPDGKFMPGLATEWKYLDTSNFEMTLRDDVVFADGETPFDATAVKANLDRLKTVSGPQTSDLSTMYESTEVVDDHKVIVHLNSPNPVLERIFSQLIGMMVNPQAIKTKSDDLALQPDGTGPYVLDTGQSVVDDTYVYTRNPHYWDPKAYAFDTLTVKVYIDDNAMLAALKSGVADVGYGSPDTISSAKGSDLTVISEPVNVFWLNLTDRSGTMAPALGDVRVRQALNFAVDRDAILKSVFQGHGKTTDQVFPEGSMGYEPKLEEFYSYDPAKAKALLADAGYADGFEFTAGIPNIDRDKLYAEALASFLTDVGVTMKIEAMPPGTYDVEGFRPYSSIVLAMGGQGAYSDAQLLAMPTGTSWNPLDSNDPEFTALWEKGTTAATAEERATAYEALSRGIVEKAWFVPTTIVDAIYYYNPNAVDGIKFIPQITVPRLSTEWKNAG